MFEPTTRRLFGIAVAAAVTAVCGCATQPTAKPPTPTSGEQNNLESHFTGHLELGALPPAAALPAYSIVRYIGVDARHWTPTDTPQNYSDLYTRVELIGPDQVGLHDGATADEPALRDYAQEDAWWFGKLVTQRTNTVSMLANVAAQDPTMSVSIPLYSVTYSVGGGQPGSWTTNFTSSNVSSPLFRIGPNTSLTVHLNAQVSTDVKTQGAAVAIGAITTAVKIAAPQSTLLTTLSAPDISNTATAIDTSLSALLSRNITEDIALGRLTDSWSPKATIALTGCAPFVRTESLPTPTVGCGQKADLDKNYDIPVGVWQLRLACPRFSVFDARDLCHAIGAVSPRPAGSVIDITDASNVVAIKHTLAGAAQDAEILSFKLSSQTDVQTFVQAQAWYSTFITAPSGGGSKTAADYADFCNGAVQGLEANGLSQFDAALVLRAMIDQMPKVAAHKADFANPATGAACNAILQAAQTAAQ